MVNYDIGNALLIAYVPVALLVAIIGSVKKWSMKQHIIGILSISITLVILLTFWAKTLTLKAGLSLLILVLILVPLSVKIRWEYLEDWHRSFGLDKQSKNTKDED